jgi:hypothetical protein
MSALWTLSCGLSVFVQQRKQQMCVHACIHLWLRQRQTTSPFMRATGHLGPEGLVEVEQLEKQVGCQGADPTHVCMGCGACSVRGYVNLNATTAIQTS